jgi:transcriptional antiterminator RfaH
LGGESARSAAEDFENRGWWLLHTKPRQEKKLAEELRTLGIGHYLPVTRLKAVTRGRPRYSWAPLFPGYCFLWADDDERLATLRTSRLVHTYSIGDQSRLAQQLGQLAQLIEMGIPLTIEDRLAVGQHVRVKSGLLKDQRGVVIRRSGKTRLYIYVTEILGGVSVEIEQHRLEPY